MKAGTATKLVLNMLSTGVMIKVGKTYGNMVCFISLFQLYKNSMVNAVIIDGGSQNVQFEAAATVS